MKPYEIALFKQFLNGKGMVTPFINLFKKFRIKTNPTLIEDYFLQIDPKEVCMKAFYWVVNLRWGYDYWLKMQGDFNAYLEKNAYDETKEPEPWWYLHGKFKILRTNWDAEKHWKYESRSATAKKFGITLPERLEEKNFFEELARVEIQAENLVRPKSETQEDISMFGDFSFVDLPPKYNKLKQDEISINRQNKKWSITINQIVSKEIIKQGSYKYAGLMSNKSGDIALVFNNINGVPIITSKAKKGGVGNVVINSKKLVERLVDLLNIKEKYVVVNIKEISRTDEHMAYHVIKQKI